MDNVFYVKARGNNLCTKIVQSLIDACGIGGGGKVVFEEGVFYLSTVFLRNGVHIVIPENTTILGADCFYDYCMQEKIDYPLYQDASHSYFNCSMFVGKECTDISITGGGKIDMRSVWDEDNVRNIVHRGPKCIALKECENVEISNLEINNATDLAVYFAGCKNVSVHNLKMRVYIDGVSPDNSENVDIYDCDIEAGDDAIVFKSSYTLNRLGKCENIRVKNCKLKSRCNAIKFGTETNGGFENILIENIDIRDTRITGISIESVDGAVVDGINIKNVTMKNVNAPLFIHLGKRMRGPSGLEIGEIRNVTIENLTASGPYKPYEIIAWNYDSFKAEDFYQYPWVFGSANGLDDSEIEKLSKGAWQMTSNVCGLKGKPLKNITLKNVLLELDGGIKEYKREVPEEAQDYPEVYVYGKFLPAKGIYFRHIEGLTLENVAVRTIKEDKREDFVFDDVE